MKILIAVGTLNKKRRAPDKIISQVADGLAALGNDCVVCGICFDGEKQQITEGRVKYNYMHSNSFQDASLYNFEKFINRTGEWNRNIARKKFIFRHPIYSFGIFLRYLSKNSEKYTVKSYVKQLKALINTEKPDKIIISYMPAEYALEAFDIKTDCPKYAYQLDPWGMYEAYDTIYSKDERINQELSMFQKAEWIFTTRPLLEQYKIHDRYLQYINKMSAVDFPNIFYKGEISALSSISFDPNCTNILFCGVIDDEYRSPKIFIDAMKKLLRESSLYRIYFLGTNTSEYLLKAMAEMPDKIIAYDRVEPEVAYATMSQADILLNIGNTLSNQVPSKIFDYFSLGKPIINVQKIENCPAREYFDKYPLCFTFKDWEPDTEGLENFIKSAKGKKVDFETVKSIYNTCTPEYVAAVIEDTLQKEN